MENVRDVLEELPAAARRQPAANCGQLSFESARPKDLSPADSRIIDELEAYPVHIDELVRKLELDPGKLAAALLRLELSGVVNQAPGSMFSLKTS